jgi:hypothetical protein
MGTDETKFRRLEAKIEDLEAQVRFLMQINGIDLSALRTAPDEVILGLYRDAVQLLGLPGRTFDPEVVKRWSELFIQLSEYELIRIQGMVDYDHTWEPFLQLCIRMMTSVRQHEDMATSIGMQHLYALLDRGRKNLRDAAVVMIKRFPDGLTKEAKILLQDDDLAPALQK